MMNIGMLWQDDSDKPLKEKIERAAEYYEEKYGNQADLVFVHPDEMETVKLAGVKVRSSRNVLKGHLWLGLEAGD